MGGSEHTLPVFEGKKKSKSKCYVIKNVDVAKGQQTHPGVYVEGGGGIPI